ncbi:matrix protein 2, partial [Influenza A virus (A/northern pintail/Alaska/44344-503/2007(H3N6))]
PTRSGWECRCSDSS